MKSFLIAAIGAVMLVTGIYMMLKIMESDLQAALTADQAAVAADPWTPLGKYVYYRKHGPCHVFTSANGGVAVECSDEPQP